MTITLASLMMSCAPLVHPTTLRALVEVESAGNPYAVSLNRPQALRESGIDPPLFTQPHTAREALALTHRIVAQGYTVSVGLAQINVEHLPTLNLRIADLFDPCISLRVAQRVLLDCDSVQSRRGGLSARERLQRTLVCYNAGDHAIGAHNPYASHIMRAALRHLNGHSRSTPKPA